MTDKKNPPGTEAFRKTEEFFQNPAWQREAKRQQETENVRQDFQRFVASVEDSAQQQEAEKTIRDVQGLSLQQEGVSEAKKQTAFMERSITIAEKSLRWAVFAVILATIGVLISLVSLGFSITPFWCK